MLRRMQPLNIVWFESAWNQKNPEDNTPSESTHTLPPSPFFFWLWLDYRHRLGIWLIKPALSAS